MSCNILDLYAKRHSFYQINDRLPISETDITNIIQETLRLYPSSFNSQSARLYLLYANQHQKFWQLVLDVLLRSAPSEKHETIKKRIYSFSKGYGTILYFTDNSITTSQEQQMPLYAANFKNWALQSNAILQFMIWSAFANHRIGARLQHYNPLIDDEVKEAFNIPSCFELVAQMPFGGIENIPQPHEVDNLEKKLVIL